MSEDRPAETVSDIVLLTRAMDFAARKHQEQRRKGEAKEPYINHLTEVASLVAEATDGHDVLAVLGAILHDTVEDTTTTPAELTATFGSDVASLVDEVTDDKTLEKMQRKLLQVQTAATKSRRAKLIKIADKTSNLRSLLQSPPPDWDATRRREYCEWAARVVGECRGVSPWLEARFDEAYRLFTAPRARARLGHPGTR